jgi:hypothetical protein
MGYRSDVAYTIRFNDENSYRLFIAEAKSKDLGKCFSNDDSYYEEAVCDDEKWAINFSAQSVKWYDSFPDVVMHNQLIALAEDWIQSELHRQIKDGVEGNSETTYRLGYIFTRIGEDVTDIEERAEGEYDWDWIRVSRQIITDWQ